MTVFSVFSVFSYFSNTISTYASREVYCPRTHATESQCDPFKVMSRLQVLTAMLRTCRT